MTILLRTLARKSVLDFGKYKDRSIQQILDLKNHRYLRWCYYNASKISFLPDILDEIGITEEWRIEKPGKDPEKGEQLDRLKDEKFNNYLHAISEEGEELDAIKKDAKRRSTMRKERNRTAMQIDRRDRKFFSKAAMARRNHGHF